MSKNNDKATTSIDKKLALDIPHEPVPGVAPSEYRFDPTFIKMMHSEPFLGMLSSYIPKVANWEIDTAAVALDRKSGFIQMYYNPEFMRRLTDKQKLGLLRHELYHVALGHLTRRTVLDPKKRQYANAAMDLAINSIIQKENLPECGLFPGSFPQFCNDEGLGKLIESFPVMESMEWYMEKLIEYAKSKGLMDDENKDVMIGLGMDGHDLWDEIEGLGEGDVEGGVGGETIKDMIDQKIQNLVEKAVKEVVNRGNTWGTVPQAIQQLILEMLQPKEVDWRVMLKNFLARIVSRESESTIRRLNKKLPYVFPGVRRSSMAKLAFFIDQSGSMCDEDVARCFNEVQECSNLAAIDVYNFDTEIDEDSHRVWKRSSKYEWKRTRCGGTDFNAVAQFVNRHDNRGRWTGVVILTDGYAPTMGQILGPRVLWIITEQGTKESVRENDLVVQMSKLEK